MNSDQRIGEFLRNLTKAYPSQKLESASLDAYFMSLKNALRDVDLSALLKELPLQHKFFPSIKEIQDEARARRQTPKPQSSGEWSTTGEIAEAQEKISVILNKLRGVRSV